MSTDPRVTVTPAQTAASVAGRSISSTFVSSPGLSTGSLSRPGTRRSDALEDASSPSAVTMDTGRGPVLWWRARRCPWCTWWKRVITLKLRWQNSRTWLWKSVAAPWTKSPRSETVCGLLSNERWCCNQNEMSQSYLTEIHMLQIPTEHLKIKLFKSY